VHYPPEKLKFFDFVLGSMERRREVCRKSEMHLAFHTKECDNF